MKKALGLTAAALGLFVLLFPFVSIWRASGQTLEQLPEIQTVEFSDESYRIGALFDEEMILARRSYSNFTPGDLELSLAAAGFQPTRSDDQVWLTKECCGEWDAVWVRMEELPNGDAVAVTTMFDSDIQATWPVLSIFGLTLLIVGAVTLGRSSGQPRTPASDAASDFSNKASDFHHA